MKDQTNKESLDPILRELPVTASRPGAASAQDEEKNGAFPADVGVIRHRLHYGDQPKPKGTGKLVT